MLHSLPQPHSSTVRPTADPLNRQPTTTLEYTPREPYHHLGNGIPSSPVNADSPTVSMSQPTTPRPTGSPPQSVTQPSSSPKDDPYPPQPPPYLMNTSIRRKRRESDYTSDTPTFGMTHYRGNIYATDKSTILDVQIQSKVDRGFFLADNDWTCYRRNYFQTSSSFSLQGVVVLYEGQELPCLVEDQEDKKLHPVDQFYIGISARLSDCSKPISLIQHTAKRDKGPQTTPEPKAIRPGGNLSFSSVGANQSIVTFERIQFKSATANNGKRRAAQQYYVVVVELYAKVRSSDKLIPVASTDSQSLVVRGRSPGHYAESHASSTTTKVNNEDTTPGGPMRRSYHQSTPLTSPPMIPGHHPTYAPHAPMYASDYPSYDYPSHGNGTHYAYAPHAGVPMVPPPHSPNLPYDYQQHQHHQLQHPPHHQHQHPHHHLPPPPQQQQQQQQQQQATYLPPPPTLMQPPRSEPSYEHYPSLPPPQPMYRSESAPSTTDHHFNATRDEEQRWTRVRMASTPDHPPPSSFLPHPHEHHTYYNQPQPYYHPPPHLPPPGRQSEVAAYPQWRGDPRHQLTRMEPKPEL